MKKQKNKKQNDNHTALLVFSIVVLLLGISCTSKTHRNFFIEMKPSFKSFITADSVYFLKDFQISNTPEKIEGAKYWEIRSDKKSIFYIAGFARQINDSIIIKPPDSKGKKYKLFDFAAAFNDSWNVIWNDDPRVLYGDSIVYKGLKSKDESIYTFDLYPYFFYTKNQTRELTEYWFRINVSEKYGIIDIVASRSSLSRLDTSFHVILFPNEKFIDKRIYKTL